ncbi:hypothetical protein G5I_09303 [Acromyrmex echinatior]|uniref:Uncharacterized protein n=1 Tax=Acromyrmex echinatior TaxID=103372 RepID=F4WTV1_ACREC|nr:hypothetical protein G5I_09303 [Acromyrmex echinatior]
MLEIVRRCLSFKAKVSAPSNRVTQLNNFFFQDDSFPLNTDTTPRFAIWIRSPTREMWIDKKGPDRIIRLRLNTGFITNHLSQFRFCIPKEQINVQLTIAIIKSAIINRAAIYAGYKIDYKTNDMQNSISQQSQRTVVHPGQLTNFVAGVLQFQLYRALCQAAGQRSEIDNPRRPLHRCDFYRKPEAGRILG